MLTNHNRPFGQHAVKKPLKKALFEHYWNYFSEARKKRAELAAHLDYVQQVLREGASRARSEAARTLQRARKNSGLE